MSRKNRTQRVARRVARRATPALIIYLAVTSTTVSAAAPPIRMSAKNTVPACVTAERLNRFLADQIHARGYRLAPRFRDIAVHYRQHGEQFRVRWDFAFFQMALETNFLSFRRGNGKRGDVHPGQNNFAGLGTTGGGVPGDRYPNVSTGVLAQIQHLVVYSGERLHKPVGHRTRLKQDVILQSVSQIARRRAVTFGDLAGRWAADRKYDRSIRRLANLFYSGYCDAGAPPRKSVARAPVPIKPRSPGTPPQRRPQAAQVKPSLPIQKPAQSPAIAKSKPTVAHAHTAEAKPLPLRQAPPQLALEKPSNDPVKSCRVQTASYGGNRTVLIESRANETLKLTALNVHPGFEIAMAANFIQAHAPNGRTIGAFDTSEKAVSKAREICSTRVVMRAPTSKPAP